jgi:hypothetical protein
VISLFNRKNFLSKRKGYSSDSHKNKLQVQD